jgi:hypothetical protein
MTGFEIEINGKKKSKKRENVQIRLSEEMLNEWRQFVESDPGLLSVSKLIRTAVNQYTASRHKYAEFQLTPSFQKLHDSNWKNYYRIKAMQRELMELFDKNEGEQRSLADDFRELELHQTMSNILTQKIYDRVRDSKKLKAIVSEVGSRSKKSAKA